jgi:hypothetical protein
MNEKSRLVPVPPPIAPQDVLRIAREDCEEYQQLAFESASTGARIFSALTTTVMALAEAGNKQAAHDAIYSMVAWCEKYDQQQLLTSVTSRPEVEREVARLKEWLREVYRLMEPLQDEKNDIDDLQQQDTLSNRCAALQRSISELATLAEPIEKKVAKLEHYLSSLVVVERGISGELLEKPLPSLSDSVGIKTTDISMSGELVSAPVTFKVKTEVSGDRVRDLNALASDHGLLAIQIMVFSLFDLFGPWNALFAGKQRSLMRVLQTSDDLGILESYGWTTTARDALKGTHWGKDAANVATFLKYAGNVSGNTLFVRNGRTLPWDARSLFTEKEVEQFLATMKATVPKRA